MADLLDPVDDLAARRPIAARVVAMTGDDTSSSKDLAAVLMADVTLTARVMRLGDNAHYGGRGRRGPPRPAPAGHLAPLPRGGRGLRGAGERLRAAPARRVLPGPAGRSR